MCAVLIVSINADSIYAATLDSLKDTLTNTYEDASKKTQESLDAASKKANEVYESTKEKASETYDKTKEKANEAYDTAKEKTNEAAGKAKDAANSAYDSASQYVNYVITQIDTKRFKAGWDKAAALVSTNYAAALGSNYVTNVQKAITATQNSIVEECKNNRTVASKAGFVAEDWHTGTFNVDAAVKGSKYSADKLGVTDKASVDIAIKNGEEVVSKASSKYYKDATGSASAQAKTIMQNYAEYQDKELKKGSKDILSFNEYLDKNVQLKEAYDLMKSEYASEYAGQTRLIPADQLDEAQEYLRKKIAKESVKEGPNRKALAKSTQDTLDNLADHINAPDGTKSTPLSADEARAIVELCDEGDFNIEDFNISTSQVIAPKYILKQSISAGSQAAALQMALEVGPDVYAIIKEGIENGEIDKKKLEKEGIDAAIAGANGFVEGSVSAALITACQAGKLGSSAKKLSPDVIGTLTVIMIDAAKYGYKLSQGEITPVQYGDLMAEEIFVAMVSQTSGVALAMIMPWFPLAYMAGSMAGGMLASAAYSSGKEVVLQVAAGNGFEAIIPSTVTDTVNIGVETVSSINIKDKTTELKNMVVSTTNAGLIKVKPN